MGSVKKWFSWLKKGWLWIEEVRCSFELKKTVDFKLQKNFCSFSRHYLHVKYFWLSRDLNPWPPNYPYFKLDHLDILVENLRATSSWLKLSLFAFRCEMAEPSFKWQFASFLVWWQTLILIWYLFFNQLKTSSSESPTLQLFRFWSRRLGSRKSSNSWTCRGARPRTNWWEPNPDSIQNRRSCLKVIN